MLRTAAEALARAGGSSRTATRCPVAPSSARYTVPNAPDPNSSRRRYRPPTCLPARTDSPRETPPDSDESATCTSVDILADAGRESAQPRRGRASRDAAECGVAFGVQALSGRGPVPSRTAPLTLLARWLLVRRRARQSVRPARPGSRRSTEAGSGTCESHLRQEPVMDVSVKDVPYWNTTVDPSSSSVKAGPAVRANPAAAYEFRSWRVVAC